MENPGLRLSDHERESVASRLRDAAAEGRLDVAEFGQRLDALFRAKTHGEAAGLTADLPTPTPSAEPRARRHHLRRFMGSVGTLWGIWAVILVTGGGVQGWWPLWVTVPWAIASFV
ncbi:MAG: hypothetical protein B7Z69_01180 [Actinobacteria bacterium 21-73-9]|nr:MAG: hypothetical protein B7Z69_01180 [Actinobacteria bacterium 21-73-9]